MRHGFIVLLLFCMPKLYASTLPVNLVTLEFKPFIWCEKNGAKGIYSDIITELFSRNNTPFTIACYPWKRALYDVEHGRADGLFAAFKTPERELFAHYVPTPIRKGQYVVFVRKDSTVVFETLSDFYGKTVGLSRGHSVSNEFDIAIKAGDIIKTENKLIEQSLRKLMSGRIDAYINDRVVGLHAIQELGLGNEIEALDVSIMDVNPSYIIMSKHSLRTDKKELVKRLDQTLIEMWNDGTVADIYAKYIHQQPEVLRD
ncbi:substrate-binding periplasmic protein [Vibrio sp. F74]|uniref:substrate-binding periplasmic protein n=1 Tax=Vibrio sp. F74 TaxID=700020 RepID=UPI0035F54919